MKVLVVDDQEINRLLPCALLRRLGIDAAEAADGRTALAMLGAGAFDAVLLDLSMPGTSGIEVCRSLRADARHERLRLVAYTAHAQPQTAEEIAAAGFDALLLKPIRRETLAAALALPATAP